MSSVTTEMPPMARKRPNSPNPPPARDIAKVDVDVMQDARIVVAYSGEKLADYLSRLLRPLVARDLEREQTKAIRSKKTE